MVKFFANVVTFLVFCKEIGGKSRNKGGDPVLSDWSPRHNEIISFRSC